MSLEDWLNEGRLKTHKTSQKEIDQLFAVFERDVAAEWLKKNHPELLEE